MALESVSMVKCLRLLALAMASPWSNARSFVIVGVVCGRCMLKPRTQCPLWFLKMAPIPPFPGLVRADPSMFNLSSQLIGGFHLVVIVVKDDWVVGVLLTIILNSVARAMAMSIEIWLDLLLKVVSFPHNQMTHRQWGKRVSHGSQLLNGLPLRFCHMVSQLADEVFIKIWKGLNCALWRRFCQKLTAFLHWKNIG